MRINKLLPTALSVLKPLSLLIALLFLGQISADAQLRWVRFSGSVPSNAVAGGSENGQTLYIGRVVHGNGTVHPGKIFRSGGTYICNYGYGGQEVIGRTFDILVKEGSDVRVQWIKITNNNIPGKAVAGGSENGQTMYVGRVTRSNGSIHPGKIFKVGSQNICNYGYGGQEITVKSGFEVLVAKDRKVSGSRDMLRGTYRVKVKGDNRYWHEDGLGDKLVTTRYQPSDDFTWFTFEPQSDGSHRIKVKANNRYLHLDGGGDKLLSTRYQPNDDFTRFFLEKQSDGSYRIKVKATNTYLHEDGWGDKKVSTRYQSNDDFAKFIIMRN